jgi:hypothetical protein
LTAGPLAAIQLWRFRESGRRAGVLLFGSGLAYYVAGFAVRSQEASTLPILISATSFALPLAVLLLPRTRVLLRGRRSSNAG